MRDFLNPMTCGDQDGGCSCGGTFEIVKDEPESDDTSDEDCPDDCACHDTEAADCDCDCDCSDTESEDCGDDCACHDDNTSGGCCC